MIFFVKVLAAIPNKEMWDALRLVTFATPLPGLLLPLYCLHIFYLQLKAFEVYIITPLIISVDNV